jgi:hypothetical protein
METRRLEVLFHLRSDLELVVLKCDGLIEAIQWLLRFAETFDVARKHFATVLVLETRN